MGTYTSIPLDDGLPAIEMMLSFTSSIHPYFNIISIAIIVITILINLNYFEVVDVDSILIVTNISIKVLSSSLLLDSLCSEVKMSYNSYAC